MTSGSTWTRNGSKQPESNATASSSRAGAARRMARPKGGTLIGAWATSPCVFEVEAKLRLRDRAGLERRLAALGARPGALEEQEDTFFAHPARDFARTDEALRLRRVGARLELTYKGPKQAGVPAPAAAPGGAKARIEQTLALQADPTALLAALGFHPAARLRKTRLPYRLGDVAVDLDHLEGLGDFVEVEVVAADRAAAARRVETVVAQLGLAGEPRVTQSYLELASQARS